MRITFVSPSIFPSRVAQVIALSGIIALSACQDVTAPDQVASVNASSLRLSQSGTDELADLSLNLDNMTTWSLAALPDNRGLANIVGILNGLKGHLAGGRIDACVQDVSDARAFLGSLTENEQVELGGVGVALDVIQLALDKASQ